MTATIDKLPIYAPEAERAVLCSVLLDHRLLADVSAIIEPGDFWETRHTIIFEHVKFVVEAKGCVDLNLLTDSLRRLGRLDEVGGQVYLAELLHAEAIPAHAVHYAKIVRQKSELRRLDAAAVDMQTEIVRGTEPAVVRAKFTELMERESRTDTGFNVMAWPDVLDSDCEVRYLIDGILAERQPMIVSGPQKSLKTSVVLDMAVSLATGGLFLRKWRVPQCRRVLVLSGESGLPTIRDTIFRALVAAKVETDDHRLTDNLMISTELPKLDDPKSVSQFRSMLTRESPEVVIVDPAYLMLSGEDSGNLFVMGDQLRRFAELFEKIEATPILLHHLKKGTVPDAKPGLSDIAWSGFGEFARQWILLKRREPYVSGSGRHALWLGVGGSAGHGGDYALDIDEGHHPDRYWDASVSNASEVAQDRPTKRYSASSHHRRTQAGGALGGGSDDFGSGIDWDSPRKEGVR